MAKTFWASIDMRWNDCDLLGHVNNARFVEFTQDARVRFFAETSDIKWGRHNSIVVRRMETDYERPLFLTSGPLQVEVSILAIGNSSFKIRHDICDKDRRRAARIDAVLVGFDSETNTSKPLSPEIRAVLEEYLVEA
jgi:acyl-CoA thioester hydrolase